MKIQLTVLILAFQLRENLAKSTEQLREERMKKRSSYRETDSRTLHASDLETGGGDGGRRYNPTSPLREYRVGELTAVRKTFILDEDRCFVTRFSHNECSSIYFFQIRAVFILQALQSVRL